jgi:hypothetical protein
MQGAVTGGIECQEVELIWTDDIANIGNGSFGSSVVLNMVKLLLNDSMIHQVDENALLILSIHLH